MATARVTIFKAIKVTPRLSLWYKCKSMMPLESSLHRLSGVGEKVAEKLEILGLKTVEDLIYHYPRRYEDFTHPRTIDQVVPGQQQIIEARIVSIENDISPKRRMKLTKALVADNTGQMGIVWFNQPFLSTTLKPGTTWLFSGVVERDFRGNVSMASPVIEREGRIVPIYSETAGLTSKALRKLIAQVLPTIQEMQDWLPESLREPNGLISIGEALERIHFPESIEQISKSKKRLAFDELFFLLLQIQQSKRELATVSAPVCSADIELLKQFTESLPFTLTDSQRQASWQIVQDLLKPVPMNRLLEGDVGSGKTVVGAIAALATMKSGYKAVWMAPTEILARQHFDTCQRFLEAFSIKTALLTGSTSVKVGGNVNEYDLVIGTQALIQDKVKFHNLGLVIVDEQHRFGVKQRNRLIDENTGTVPHFLAMTATPIPRTLALTVYGDLDISALQSVPTGRKPIISRFIDPAQRQEAYNFIRQQIQSGRQAFVVCPLVEQSTANQSGQLDLRLEEKKAATLEYEKLRKHIFPDLRVGLIHGKLKPAEKSAVMTAFKSHEIDILVATAVIEVGIDIPNATVMMIEGADRFGLAQLHQFRGRVGRGEHQSYCLVFTDTENSAAFERLRAFTRTTSGFELAELDLELRGPGQLAGLQQSGLSDLKLASLSDIALIQQAKSAAIAVLDEGLAAHSALQAKLDRRARAHLA